MLKRYPAPPKIQHLSDEKVTSRRRKSEANRERHDVRNTKAQRQASQAYGTEHPNLTKSNKSKCLLYSWVPQVASLTFGPSMTAILHLERLITDFITAKETARSLVVASQHGTMPYHRYLGHRERQQVVTMELAEFKSSREE